MFYLETGSSKPEHFDEVVVFASQLREIGVDARIDVRALPTDLSRTAQYDVTMLLREGDLGPEDRAVVVAADQIADVRLVHLRRLARGRSVDCLAIGTFDTVQSEIGAQAKLSYVFGRDPRVLNLADASPAGPEHPRCPVFGVEGGAVERSGREESGRKTVLLIAPELADRHQARALLSLALSRTIKVIVLTDGKTKQEWQKERGTEIAFFHYSEIMPAALARRADLCVFYKDLAGSYRARSLMANLAVSGALLFDGGSGHSLSKRNDAFIPAPTDLAGLGPYLTEDILPNLVSAGEKIRKSRFAREAQPARLLSALEAFIPASGGARTRRRFADPAGVRKAVFMPTNGVGLGHAQRCSQIACEIDRRRLEPIFAAFPSCMKLLKSYGFDVMPMVSRSALHAQTHENDLVNYSRLSTISAEASSLVFDGGYVFDSISRTILENGLKGIWIRRGLWQAEQDNSVALDREKVFDKVIVPSEAFEELNEAYSRGNHLAPVGPIVQRVDLGEDQRSDLRLRVSRMFGVSYKHLVVSMLGGGVAADRTAQINAICAMMDRLPETLHLLVVWPTATVNPNWFSWENTRVVKTHHASPLVAASDLFISAAGYNSFHEVLYNRVLTIFIPQMSTFMDDQRQRARAAVERGLAGMVEPEEMMTLSEMVDDFLNGEMGTEIRSRLAETALPAPGNAEAARIIEEVNYG